MNDSAPQKTPQPTDVLEGIAATLQARAFVHEAPHDYATGVADALDAVRRAIAEACQSQATGVRRVA